MVKNRKSARPEESVLRDAKEITAVEQYWHAAGRPKPRKPPKNYQYIDELAHLQFELIKLQEWVRLQGLKVAVIFEGRDAAGKGGVIKRITESLNPRICRVVALGTPTDRERGQWYFQRYVAELPRRGEIVLFDRSWYNRAGVERVMEFCSEDEYHEFLRSCPIFEEMLVRSGISLISIGSRSTTRSKSGVSRSASETQSSAGSSARWTWNRASAGSNIPWPRT
jgi:polyphosphate kinase